MVRARSTRTRGTARESATVVLTLCIRPSAQSAATSPVRPATKCMPSSSRLWATVLKMHSVLRKALKQAVLDGLIPRNVCEAVKPSKVERKEIKPLDREQAKALLKAARGDRLEAL